MGGPRALSVRSTQPRGPRRRDAQLSSTESPADPRQGPVVFVHGTPTWSFEWRHLVGGLKDSYRCLAADHLGFGLSERPFGAEYTPEAHARRFRAWIEALDLRDITLVVHDFGGPIALPIALEQPGRVSRLIVLNSWMWSFVGDPHIERGARILGRAFGRWLYRAFNASLPHNHTVCVRRSQEAHPAHSRAVPGPICRHRLRASGCCGRSRRRSWARPISTPTSGTGALT